MSEKNIFADKAGVKRHDIIDYFSESMPEVKNYLILSEGWKAQNVRFAFHSAYQLDENIIALDPNGDLIGDVKAPLEREGYRVYAIDLSYGQSEAMLSLDGPMEKTAFFIHTSQIEPTSPATIKKVVETLVALKEEKGGRPLRFIINGFDIAYYIADPADLLSQKAVNVTTVALNISQLKEYIGETYEAFINAFDAIFYFGCKDKLTYDYIMKNLTPNKEMTLLELANRKSMVWVRSWYEWAKESVWLEYASLEMDPD